MDRPASRVCGQSARFRRSCLLSAAWLLCPLALSAQQQNTPAPNPQITLERQILDRLDHLEQENQALAAEVRALRADLAVARAPSQTTAPTTARSGTFEGNPENTAPVPLHEQVAVQGQRIEDISQTKVESGQKFPVTLNGMVLFNAFLNGRGSGGSEDPTTVSLADSQNTGGASPAQSIVGLAFQGPRVLGGGLVTGSLQMDLWGGSPGSSLGHTLRLRTGSISIDWKNTSFMVGQDKPLIAPRDPTSLAQVAFSPLTSAGNLWLWAPQVRIEQRIPMGESTGLRAQLSAYETTEPSASVANTEYTSSLSGSRPAIQGRFELWHNFSPNVRVEIAPGFDASDTHVGGFTIPARIFSIDWKIQPFKKVQFTGAFFNGRNAAGIGGLRQGFTVAGDSINAVQAAGGWAQLSYQATGRLSFNLYGGQESDRPGDLLGGEISRNLAYAANAIYRIGPNVLVSIEAEQVRTAFVALQNRLNNHYDLALAYLF